MTTPRERSIIYTGPEVRAILDGTKTRTTVPMKPQPVMDPSFAGGGYITRGKVLVSMDLIRCHCPFRVGQRLWVKERHFISNVDRDNPKVCVEYEDQTYILTDKHPLPTLNEWGEYDDGVKAPGYLCRWRAGKFMPRWASRTPLEVTSNGVVRVQDVSEADAIAEGLDSCCPTNFTACSCGGRYARDALVERWDARHPKHPCMGNPWGWTFGHRIVEARPAAEA